MLATPLTTLDIEIGCQFDVHAPTQTACVMLVEPHPSEQPKLLRSTWTAVDEFSTLYVDVFGNLCRRLVIPPGFSSMSYSARIANDGCLDPAPSNARAALIQDLPETVLQFLLPSRFCESDKIANEVLTLFGDSPVDGNRVDDVVAWVHQRLSFAYGSTGPTTSAVEVLAAGSGVCRDFAHLAIAACRALNVPSRYAFGYLPDIGVVAPPVAMDFCAWMEVYLGGRWWTVDPRNNARRIGRVVVGRGRDAADVAMMTSFGRIDLLRMIVNAEQAA